MSDAGERVNINEAVNLFVQKNRKAIFIFFGALLVLLAVFIGAVSISGAVQEKAIEKVEDLNRRYEALRFDINEEAKAADAAALVEELTALAEKSSGYAGGWAWSLVGGIHADKKEWAEAEQAYANAAGTADKTYLAAAALFNAGAAAEEQGKNAGAIDYYTRCAAQAAVFPAAARAQFAVGRLQEALDDKSAALEAYRALVAGWPNDAVWTNLAHSRIILLERADK
jgi:tetratricopeptide (TPR) repeat protein